MHGHHALGRAVEGLLADPKELGIHHLLLQTRLLGDHDQRGLRGIPEHGVSTLGVRDLRVVAGESDAQRESEKWVGAGVHRCSVRPKLPDG